MRTFLEVTASVLLLAVCLAACASEGRDGFGGDTGSASDGVDGGAGSAGGAVGALADASSSAAADGAADGSADGSGLASDAGAGDGSSKVPPGATPWATPCTGAAITSAEVLSHFAPAATTATFGTVWADARKRQCQDQTGCQGWQPASGADLYRINWTGSGFTFINPTTVAVPSGGAITCTVPGPACTLAIGPMTSNVYPPEQGRPLGITPRVGGSQVQVDAWSSDPQGNYLQITDGIVTSTCLWGTMSGRTYGAAGAYVETQLIMWGTL